MAWTTPTTVSAGEVLTAARYNQDTVDNANALYQSIQRIAHIERTTNYTVSSTTVAGATDVFSSDLAWTAAGSTAYRIEFFCPYVDTATNAGSSISIHLVNGSGTDLGRMAQWGNADGSRHEDGAQFCVYYYTPSAGSTTLNIRALRGVANGALACGAGGIGDNVPMFLTVFGPPLT